MIAHYRRIHSNVKVLTVNQLKAREVGGVTFLSEVLAFHLSSPWNYVNLLNMIFLIKSKIKSILTGKMKGEQAGVLPFEQSPAREGEPP